MFELARQYGQGPIPLKIVASRQGVSEPYLEQLIAILRNASLVKGVRGAQGGYMLARAPKEITVGDIIRVLEGPIAPVDCVIDENSCSCGQAEQCITRNVWEKMRDSIADVIDSITLEDMVKDEKNNLLSKI